MLANKKCYNAFYQTDKFRDCLKTNCGELPDDVFDSIIVMIKDNHRFFSCESSTMEFKHIDGNFMMQYQSCQLMIKDYLNGFVDKFYDCFNEQLINESTNRQNVFIIHQIKEVNGDDLVINLIITDNEFIDVVKIFNDISLSIKVHNKIQTILQ
jgi:hypothetical protein